MHLTIRELLDYTDEERARWRDWFVARGSDPLKIALAGEAFSSVGALILHCFWAELFYEYLMRDELLLEDSEVVKQNQHLPADQVEAVFAFGQFTRTAMRAFADVATEADWERERDVTGYGLRIRGSSRKLVAHTLIHEVRHWAQIAIIVRQHGLVPPGDHDLLFSKSFGPLVTRL